MMDSISSILGTCLIVFVALLMICMVGSMKPEKWERSLGWKLVIVAALLFGAGFLPFVER